ncbi:MAG: phospholipase C/P1 nuclease family protein [Nostoc sp.]
MAIHRIQINLPRTIVIPLSTLLLCVSFPHFPSAWAWDSKSRLNVTHSTHSYLTEWAIEQIKSQFPEVQQFRTQLLEGANSELHELQTSGTKYGIDLNAKRIQHKGTNEGCDDIKGWWQDSLSAYKSGNKEQAYFLTGVMLHMIEDMGVPAHANKVYHQGKATLPNSTTSST